MMYKRAFLFLSMIVMGSFAMQFCASPVNQQEGSTESIQDGSTTKEQATGTFACGDKKCQIGKEYCQPRAPGICTGEPVPSSGRCPANCQAMQCGPTGNTCVCTSYSCPAFPSGCSDCNCLKAQNGGSSCTCAEKDGGLTLNCPSP